MEVTLELPSLLPTSGTESICPGLGYRGRVAPTPTGYLHAGHAATFWTAFCRARSAGGKLVLRVEDLDSVRCRPEYVAAAEEDLRWLGIRWDEGPELGGSFQPYVQSQRMCWYREAWDRLHSAGYLYPCMRTRRDVETSPMAPHGEEQIFPPAWRPSSDLAGEYSSPEGVNWRFRVPDGQQIEFHDGRCGKYSAVAGRDFGDFLVWRKDGVPSYELAVVVDDIAMKISEVVRGEDLLLSTCRQLLLYEALQCAAPAFFHCPLILDSDGKRLAKRDAARTIQTLRSKGVSPEELLNQLGGE